MYFCLYLLDSPSLFPILLEDSFNICLSLCFLQPRPSPLLSDRQTDQEVKMPSARRTSRGKGNWETGEDPGRDWDGTGEREKPEWERTAAGILSWKGIQEGGRRAKWLDDDESHSNDSNWEGKKLKQQRRGIKTKWLQSEGRLIVMDCFGMLECWTSKSKRSLPFGKKHLSYSLLLTHVEPCDKLNLAYVLQVEKMRPRSHRKSTVQCSWPNFQFNFKFFLSKTPRKSYN